MFRTALGVVGVLTTLFPDRMIEVFESAFIENPEECTTTSFSASSIRTEGVFIVAVTLIGGRVYTWLLNAAGVFGAVAFLFPETYRRFASAFLYENAEDVEWTDRSTDAIRTIGLAYVLLAGWAYRTRNRAD